MLFCFLLPKIKSVNFKGQAMAKNNHMEKDNKISESILSPKNFSASPPVNQNSGADENAFFVKILNSIITICLSMLFFGLPVFFTGITFQGIAFDKQIYFYFWLLIALVAWAAKGVITGEMKIRRTPLDIPILIFLAAYIAAVFFSIDRWHSFWGFFGDPSRGLVSLIGIILAYYLIFIHFNEKRLKIFLSGLVASGFLVSTWSALAVMGIKFLPEKIAVFAPISLLGSVTGLGIFLSAMIPLIVTAIFKTAESVAMKKIYKMAILVFLGLDLIVTMLVLLPLYSYVPWISLLIGVGIFLIYVLSRVIRPSEKFTWLPMLVFIFILSFVMAGTNQIARINLPVEVSPNYSLSWQIAKEAVRDKFFIGSGPATYGYDFSLYKPQNFNFNPLYNLRFYQATSIPLETLVTTGVVGFVALMIIMLSFVSISFYLLSREKEKNKLFSLGLVVASVICIISVVLLRVEGSILILGGLICALALAALLRESGSEEKVLNLSLKSSPRFALTLAFIFMVVCAGVVFLFVFVGKVFLADVYAGQAARQPEVSEDKTVGKLLKGIDLYNLEGRYFTRIGQEYMILANRELVKAENERDIEKIRFYLNNSVTAATRGKDMMSKDVLAVESLAQIYENAGLFIKDSIGLAEENYKKAGELDPHNPIYLIKLGQIKLALAADKKDDEKKQLVAEAKDFFQQSTDKKINLSAGYYNLSLTQDALGEKTEAIENMKKAFSLEADNINYAFNLARLYQTRGEGDDYKFAEALYKKILETNKDEINTHFGLGTLYEKMNKRDEAIAEYRKVSDLISGNQAELKRQLDRMISNVRNGIENTPQNINPPAVPEEENEIRPVGP